MITVADNEAIQRQRKLPVAGQKENPGFIVCSSGMHVLAIILQSSGGSHGKKQENQYLVSGQL